MAGPIRIRNLKCPALAIYGDRAETYLYHCNEPEPGLFIAETAKVIGRALDAGYRPVSVLVEEGRRDPELLEILRRLEEVSRDRKDPEGERLPEVPFYTAPSEVLKEIAGFPLTRGILCAMRRKRLPSPEEILAGARRIAVFCRITNPTNLGAMFRSAAALGMDAVILSPGCTDPLYRRAARVSMGTVFQVPWTVAGDWAEPAGALKKLGVKTAAMALSGNPVPVTSPELKKAERLALLLGNEGDGLPQETIEAADYTITIPMSHGVDSLNVAAAAAVAFWELGNRGRNG